ncbi:peptidase [Catellatospora paridis]|uniref:peptidase n=1 Tax=Catellatospora paridis TaxID=1617086 RepID=UPI001E5EAA5F|nr:peptidase [Catellatospora paridis]
MLIHHQQGHVRLHNRLAAAAFAIACAALLPAAAAAAPSPSPGSATVNRSGTSFLTATAVGVGQPVQVAASTGDYLYWSFSAAAGQITEIALTVSLPPAGKRTGASTWTVDVFDGLRRRQACTAGVQTPIAAATATSVSLGCSLRRVRSWAEPWSGDPLPGTYYIRLSVTDLPEPDLGLPIQVDMLLGAHGDSNADDGELKAPLVPRVKPGEVMAEAGSVHPSASPSPTPDEATEALDWLPDLSARWIWTTVGGVLAAAAGVVGFSLTWRRRK